MDRGSDAICLLKAELFRHAYPVLHHETPHPPGLRADLIRIDADHDYADVFTDGRDRHLLLEV